MGLKLRGGVLGGRYDIIMVSTSLEIKRSEASLHLHFPSHHMHVTFAVHFTGSIRRGDVVGDDGFV